MSVWRHLVAGSLRAHPTRTLLALLALVLGATLSAALLDLSTDVRARVGHELRGYGANLVVSAQNGSMSEERLGQIDSLPSHASFAGWSAALAGITTCGSQKAVLVGVDFDRLRAVSPYLKVDGAWPSGNDVAIGWRLAQTLGVQPGASLTVGGKSYRVSGLIESGGDEDNQVFAALPLAQQILGKPGRISTIAFSVTGDATARVASEIESKWNDASARVIQQIASSEASFLDHVSWLMGALTAFIFLVAGLCVMTTMFTQVTERRKEIGLMKALGASDRRIALLFMSEAIVLGGVAGLIGYPFGVLLARSLGMSLFGAMVTARPMVLPAVIALAVALAVAAQILPLRRALAIAPAATLRGE